MAAAAMMILLMSLITLWACSQRSFVDAYENGAPCAAQHNLHPSSVYHGESRDLRRSPPPYRFFIAEFDDLGIRTYTPGRTYTLRIIALDGAHFRGFLIQPRLTTKEGSLIGNLRAGRFLVDQNQMDEYGIQFQECAPFKNDSITHRNGTLKYFLETKWTVEKNYGPIQFVLTMVQEQDEFWEQWRPTTGLLLPDDRNNEDLAATASSVPEEDAELKKIKLLSQKLEYHKAKKTNGEIGFVAHDVSETEEEAPAPGATAPPPAPTPSKKKQQGAATTVPPPTEAASESEETSEEQANNETEIAAAPKKPQLTRVPTPKPPAEEEETGDEEDETETEGTTPKTVTIDHKLEAAANSSSKPYQFQLKPKSEEEEASEEETDEATDSSKPPVAPAQATKTPFRIPLSSLGRLRELFKQGQQRSKNYTLSPEKISEFVPTPNPDEAAAEEESEEESVEGSKPPKAPAARPKPTLPAANRIEFPTLPPFPVDKPKEPKSEEEEDGSPPIPRLPQTGDPEGEGDEDSAGPRMPPPKIAKPVQPVIRLLKGATLPPDAEGETDEAEDDKEVVDEKPIPAASAPKKPKGSKAPKATTAAGSTTTTLDPDFEDITSALPTAEAAPLDEAEAGETSEATTTVATTRVKGARPPKPTGLPKVGEETEGDLLPPAASALSESEFSGNSSAPLDGPPIADASPSNETLPVRRTVLVDGTNTTVEEENDSSILKEQDFCSSSPCLNKATCLSLADEDRYECKCNDGWAGRNCDERDFCGKKSPCQNGGHCVNEDFGYTCNCTNLWVGKNCENKCPSDLCKNGGTCGLSEGNGGYSCTCKPGFTGNQCETDINECENSPCQNGGTCEDKVNAFKCLCVDGYMGDKCHRPCQNIYKSCPTWGEEGRCESTRHTTRWFDINCGVTCGQCVYLNETVKTLSPLPPVLEPLHFLIGRWTVNTSHMHRYPIDFTEGNAGYYEEIEFAPVNVPMFGTPSINYTAVSYNNQFPDDVVVTHGFMTLKPNISPIKVALMTTGNEGLTMIEEGTLPNYYTLEMKIEYFAPIPAIAEKMPTMAKRQFTLYGGFLRETVERQSSNNVTDYFTKYFYKGAEFQIY